ncbi:MAG: hypothetical protein ACRCWR_11775 [Saezia sp.]
MKLNLLPSTTGLLWLKKAYTIFRAYSKVYMTLFGACYLLIVLIFIDGIVLAALGILCSIAMMVVTHELLHQQLNPQSPVVLDIFSQVLRHKNSLILILLYSLCFYLVQSFIELLCMQLTPNFYAQALEYSAIFKSPAKTPPEILLKAYPYIVFMQFLRLIVPYMVLFPIFCMTPALIFWGKQPVLKALVFNLVAIIKNRQTWLIFILSWTLISIATFLFAAAVFALCAFLFGKAGIALGTILALIFAIALCAIGSAIMSAALYFAYQSSFIKQPQ